MFLLSKFESDAPTVLGNGVYCTASGALVCKYGIVWLLSILMRAFLFQGIFDRLVSGWGEFFIKGLEDDGFHFIWVRSIMGV